MRITAGNEYIFLLLGWEGICVKVVLTGAFWGGLHCLVYCLLSGFRLEFYVAIDQMSRIRFACKSALVP